MNFEMQKGASQSEHPLENTIKQLRKKLNSRSSANHLNCIVYKRHFSDFLVFELNLKKAFEIINE